MAKSHPSVLLSILLITLAAAGTGAVKFHVTTATPALRSTFNRSIGVRYATQTMTTASSFIFKTFHQRDVADRKPLRNVTVFIDNSADHGLLVNNNNNNNDKNGTETNEFRIGVNCFSNVSSSTAVREFSGLVYHYMTYVWGWNGRGKAPAGLISGMADYVRWKADLGLPVKAASVGKRWDQGYEVTAKFLDYCNDLKATSEVNGTASFVAGMNKLMKDGYSDEFFKKLSGKSVGQLWREYKNTVGKGPFQRFPH